MIQIFKKLFFIERSSISISLFRIVVAMTMGLYLLPSFCHPADNYLSTAFREYNPIKYVNQKTTNKTIKVITSQSGLCAIN